MKADMCQGSADVHINNVQSQALCKSLGGKRGLRTCWSVEWFRAFFLLLTPTNFLLSHFAMCGSSN